MLKELYEQPLHTLWAWAALVVFYYTPIPILDGVLGALVLALPREIVDQWPIQRPLDTLVDLSFFALGGALAGLMRWLLHARQRRPP